MNASAADPSAPHELPEPTLPQRDRAGHKGTFGTVLIAGGCALNTDTHQLRMPGAPALASLAALRAGAGLVRVLAPAPLLDTILAINPSATGLVLPTDELGRVIGHEAARAFDDALASASVLAIGPGLGPDPSVESLVLRSLMQQRVPVVVDADGLNAMARIPSVASDIHASAILTPHPGEFARLARAFNLNADPIDPARRMHAAASLAGTLGCIVVLKGHHTVVSNSVRTWVCQAGHPCMATAGSGDVLTGAIAGIVAQFGPSTGHGQTMDLFDATRAAVYAHSLAGERWATSSRASAGMLAAELADELPLACEMIRQGDTKMR